MPSAQAHIGTNGGGQSNCTTAGIAINSSLTNKPPLPSKLPPPPPPPPKDLRPPSIAPPPPPPPRNSSQFSSQSNLSSSSQLCIGTGPSNGSTGGSSVGGLILNNAPASIGSLNSSGGRYLQSSNNNHSIRNAFTRHGECSSRSSISSHNSFIHHHNIAQHNVNINGPSNVHQLASSCQSNHQHNHLHSDILHHQSICQTTNYNGCCVHSLTSSNKCQSQTSSNTTLRIPHISSSGSATMPNHTTLRSTLFATDSSTSLTGQLSKNACCGINEFNNGHMCLPPDHLHYDHQNHHHHHHPEPSLHQHQNLHSIQLSSGSSVSSSLQPIDQTSMIGCNGGQSFQERCNNTNDMITMQSNGRALQQQQQQQQLQQQQQQQQQHQGLINSGTMDQIGKLIDGCEHHQHDNCLDHQHHHHHHHDSPIECQHQATCGGCSVHNSSSDTSVMMHNHNCADNCNRNLINHGYPSNALHHHHHHHHHGHARGQSNRCFESSPSGPEAALVATHTAHTHNLSNSSTTTHTSNVAVRQQNQLYPFDRHVMSRSGGRSNSSQQCDNQYRLSSAASTSATASLSSYNQASLSHDDSLYPRHHNINNSNRLHQPLPPVPPVQPPPPPPHTNISTLISATKSQPASPTPQVFVNPSMQPPGVIPSTVPSTLVGAHQFNQHQHQTQAPAPPMPMLAHPLPPLPPKPASPNTSSCSTQVTTVRTSPGLQNQPVTRLTSQAGVQNPLPNSDIPPPLPPLNPGSRLNLIHSRLDKVQSGNYNNGNEIRALELINSNNNSTMSSQTCVANSANGCMNLISLNYQRGGIITDAERKTEQLTRQVELELDHQQKSAEPLGICPKCNTKVFPAQEACKAMNQIYHANCFVCCECGRTLLGKTFYPVGDQVYCEEDYKYTGHMQSLEKCAECGQPIFDMILPAIGKSYHPKCFKCCVCGRCLDGVPFTIDRKDKIYCVEDYHKIYSPKCAACGKTISPIDGTGETVRVVSMDKDYHVDCYCCEDCGLQLTDEEPSRSYPLDNHLLCEQCHINRLSKRQAALSLS